MRRPVGDGRGYPNVVARSDDGERFETVASVDKDRFGAESLERPALTPLPGGGWRLYVSCATPGTLHWSIEAVDAPTIEGLDRGRRTSVLAGDESTGVKDPVVVWSRGLWHMWVCCHTIDPPEDADAMLTRYATSTDGLRWELHGVALAGRRGRWDARGARITSVLLGGRSAVAYYDGRASAEANWEEQTGIAVGTPNCFEAEGGRPVGTSPAGGALRYVSVVGLAGGGHRLYYEAARRDGAHDLRTEYAPPARSARQSA
jgi:hypothetical protein